MKRSKHKKIVAEIDHGLKTNPDVNTRRQLEKNLYQADALLKEQAS